MKRLLFIALLFSRAFAQCDTAHNNSVSGITTSTATLSVTAAAGSPITYNFAIVRSGHTDTVYYAGASTVKTLSNLLPGTTYKWYVQTYFTGGCSHYQSGRYSFTTLSNTVVYTPMTAAGYQYKYVKVDSGLSLPFHDTALLRGSAQPGIIICNSRDSALWYFTGLVWKPVIIDSFGVMAKLAHKVDSVTIVGDNLTYWIEGTSYGKGPIFTASNLVTKVGNDIQFGGTATKNDTLDLNNHTLFFNDNASSDVKIGSNKNLDIDTYGGGFQVTTYSNSDIILNSNQDIDLFADNGVVRFKNPHNSNSSRVVSAATYPDKNDTIPNTSGVFAMQGYVDSVGKTISLDAISKVGDSTYNYLTFKGQAATEGTIDNLNNYNYKLAKIRKDSTVIKILFGGDSNTQIFDGWQRGTDYEFNRRGFTVLGQGWIDGYSSDHLGISLYNSSPDNVNKDYDGGGKSLSGREVTIIHVGDGIEWHSKTTEAGYVTQYNKVKVYVEANGGSFKWTIGGAYTTISIANNPGHLATYTLDMGSLSNHNIYFEDVSGTIRILGVEFYNDLVKGVDASSSGMSGLNSTQWLNLVRSWEFKESFQAYSPDMYVISLGSNDYYFGSHLGLNPSYVPIPITTYKANMSAIVDSIRSYSPTTSIVLLAAIDHMDSTGVTSPFILGYEQALKQIAFSKGVGFLSLNTLHGGGGVNYKTKGYRVLNSDWIHYTVDGGGVNAKTLLDKVNTGRYDSSLIIPSSLVYKSGKAVTIGADSSINVGGTSASDISIDMLTYNKFKIDNALVGINMSGGSFSGADAFEVGGNIKIHGNIANNGFGNVSTQHLYSYLSAGIGTITPDSTLQVVGSIKSSTLAVTALPNVAASKIVHYNTSTGTFSYADSTATPAATDTSLLVHKAFGTSGSVLFKGATGVSQDNPNLFWDSTDHRLGIGVTSPNGNLHVANSSDSRTVGIFAGSTKAVRLGSKSGSATIDGVDNTGVASYQQLTLNGSQVTFAIQGSDVGAFNSSGNLGAGTTSPSARLEATSTVAGNPAVFNVYHSDNTAHNITLDNNVGARMQWTTNSKLLITSGGTTIGNDNAINFQIGGATKWQVDGSGNYIAGTDNTYDIGASGANRPRNIFTGGSVVAGLNMFVGQSQAYYITNRATIKSDANGNIGLYNYAENDFTRLDFGGIDATHPAIARNGAGIDIKLADNSAYTTIKASTITSTATVILAGYTVATLPAGIVGMTAYVTDATAPTYNGTLTGGGGVTVPVFYNGSAWISY